MSEIKIFYLTFSQLFPYFHILFVSDIFNKLTQTTGNYRDHIKFNKLTQITGNKGII